MRNFYFIFSLILAGCIIRINSKYDDFDTYQSQDLGRMVSGFKAEAFGSPLMSKTEKFQEIEAKDLKPFLGKKSLTWIYSWGPHCPPCVAKLPVYDSLATIYERKGSLQWVSLSYEYDLYFMQHAYRRFSLTHRTYLLRNTVRGKMKMADKIHAFENELCPGVLPYDHGFPTHYVFRADGSLAWCRTGALPVSLLVRVIDSLERTQK